MLLPMHDSRSAFIFPPFPPEAPHSVLPDFDDNNIPQGPPVYLNTDDVTVSEDSPASWDSDLSLTPAAILPTSAAATTAATTAAAAAAAGIPSPSKSFNLPDIDASMDDLAPKIEEQDSSDDLHSIKTSTPSTADINSPSINSSSPSSFAPVNPPRKRGRPRKNPLPVPGAQVKITKGRSKTGCVTCRRRKKKCDEAKPFCFNCQKNAVVCEGYPPKELWKSGRQKLEEGKSIRGTNCACLYMHMLSG